MPYAPQHQVTIQYVRHDVARDGTITKTLVVCTNMATTPGQMGFNQGEFDPFVAEVIGEMGLQGADRAEILGPH